MKVVLAFDLGTTGNRVLAFSKKGEVVAKSYYEFKQLYPKPGWVEHDPLEIWQTTQRAFQDVVRKVGGENIVSAGITNQRETVVLWDKNTGEPVYNAIVWQCRRTTERCLALEGQSQNVKEKTGLPIDPYFSASKLQWILDSSPTIRIAAEKGDLLFGTIDTWILWNLTCGRVHASEPSNLSRTMLFNINTLDYDKELLGLFQVPRSILPEIKESADDFGTIHKSISSHDIPLTAILGDQQASLFGQWGGSKNVVKNTYGTGLFLMTPTDKPVYSDRGLLTTVGWKYQGDTVYALEGSVFTGGAIVQWLRDGLKIIPSAEASEKSAKSLEDNGGVYFVPALAGLGAPYWDPKARGTILGITGGTKQEHITRAALESLAYQVRDVIELMKDDSDFSLRALRVDGGAAANNFLMQFQSDILGLNVERSANLEATSFGVAGLSGIFSGFWTEQEFFNQTERNKIFSPTMKREEADSLYSRWGEAVIRSRNWAD